MSTTWSALGSEWLLALVRTVAVVVGILGTGIAAPTAVRTVWDTTRRPIVSAWYRLRARLGFPSHRNIDLADGSTSLQGFGTLTASGEATSHWPEDPSEQVEQLRLRTESLEKALNTLRVANHAEIQALRAEIEGVRTHHETQVEALRAEQQERDREDLRVNARGLPLIGASIVLSGLPDPVVANPWFAWPLLALSMIVSVVVVRGLNASASS